MKGQSKEDFEMRFWRKWHWKECFLSYKWLARRNFDDESKLRKNV